MLSFHLEVFLANMPIFFFLLFLFIAIDCHDLKILCSAFFKSELPISDRVDRGSATEAVDSGSITGGVKPKTLKIGIHSFPA